MNINCIISMLEEIKYSTFFSEKIVCYLVYRAIENTINYENTEERNVFVVKIEDIAKKMHIPEEDFEPKWPFLLNDFSIDETSIYFKNDGFLSKVPLFSEVMLNIEKKEIDFIIAPFAAEVIKEIEISEIETYIDTMAMFNTSLAFSLYKILINGDEKRSFTEVSDRLEKYWCFENRDLDVSELESNEDRLVEIAIDEINEVADIRVKYEILNRAECESNDGIVLVSKK